MRNVVRHFDQRNVKTKTGNKFHLSDNNFQLQFSVKILRNDRSEAFCGSSGKILHLTLSGFVSVATKNKTNFNLNTKN